MRIAQVVQVDRAGVVRALQVRREDRVQRPLLEHQLRDARGCTASGLLLTMLLFSMDFAYISRSTKSRETP